MSDMTDPEYWRRSYLDKTLTHRKVVFADAILNWMRQPTTPGVTLQQYVTEFMGVVIDAQDEYNQS